MLLAVALAAFFTTLDEPLCVVPLSMFIPDLFMVGDARSTRTDAAPYDVAPFYRAPALLGAIAVGTSDHLWKAVAVVWFARIGMDRALGYGLKCDNSLAHTNRGSIGR